MLRNLINQFNEFTSFFFDLKFDVSILTFTNSSSFSKLSLILKCFLQLIFTVRVLHCNEHLRAPNTTLVTLGSQSLFENFVYLNACHYVECLK